jgi:hypothetical protein
MSGHTAPVAPKDARGESPGAKLNEGLAKLLANLPVQLGLMAVVLAIVGWFLITPKGQPPSVPLGEVLAFIAIAALIVLVAAGLWLVERRSVVLSANAIAEEAAAKANLAAQKEDELNRLRHFVWQMKGQPGSESDIWTRPTIRLPLDRGIMDRIISVLADARNTAATRLAQVSSKAKADCVRANVFLPETGRAGAGDVNTLVIPHGDGSEDYRLQFNMTDPAEIDIQLRPGQGATGRVYKESVPLWLQTNPSWLKAEGEDRSKHLRWLEIPVRPDVDTGVVLQQQLQSTQDRFHMPDFLQGRVDNELTWIITLPIFLPSIPSVAIGVLNVDCLGCQIRPQDFTSIYSALEPFPARIAHILSEVARDRITIVRFSEFTGIQAALEDITNAIGA